MKKQILTNLTICIGVLALVTVFNNCSAGFTASNFGNSSAQSASTSSGGPTNIGGPVNTTPPSQYAANTYTGWPLQFIGIDISSAYPNIQYYNRFTVRGGLYPYTFKLLKAPAGMQIQTRTGEIKWTPTQNDTSANVEVEVTDSAGNTLTHAYTINVTTNGFYFVNSASGNDSNPGTLAQPFQTLNGVMAKNLPGSTILYVQAGTYPLSGSIQMSNMPGIIMAYPGTRPVIDCQNLGNCFHLDGTVKNPVLFQGFEMENCSFKFFSLDGYKYSATWRNNIMHNINVTNPNNAYENPAFIFTWDYTNSPTPVYQNLIVQNNQFYNMQNYQSDIHIAAFTWYDVSHSVVEDNVIHDINRGACFDDKDDGWYNTFRNNICYNSNPYGFDFASQYTEGQEEINNNLFIGNANDTDAIQVGMQPGYIQDVYIHNNTIINGTIDFGYPFSLANTQKFVIKNNIFYIDGTVNVSSLPFYHGDPSVIGQDGVAANNNIYWSSNSAQPMIAWGWSGSQLEFSGWQKLGYDINSSFGVKPTLSTDGTYSLSPSNPDYGVYGKDFSAGVWQ